MPAGTKKPEQFEARTKAWLQDKLGRVGDEVRAHIDAAVKQYSADRPLTDVADQAGDGTNDVTLPSAYVDGFSHVSTVEFPIGEIPEAVVDRNEWTLYRKPAGLVLRLYGHKPTAQQNVRITFTRYHSQGNADTTSTIPDGDFEAVCALAASYAAHVLANSYAQNVDPTLPGATFVDGRAAGEAERTAARELRAIYEKAMGLKPAGADAPRGSSGQAFVDWDTRGSAGQIALTHPPRWH